MTSNMANIKIFYLGIYHEAFCKKENVCAEPIFTVVEQIKSPACMQVGKNITSAHYKSKIFGYTR